MSKIVLIYPRFPIEFKLNIPIGLLHLGTYLKNNGFEVRIVDCTVQPRYKEIIEKEIRDATCIGISLMTAQIPHAREISRFIKGDLRCKALLIFGGVHPTLYPKKTIQEEFIDYVVVGEGELPLLSILNTVKKNDAGAINNISGLVYLDKNGSVCMNSCQEAFDYAQMPPFDYSLLDKKILDAYKEEGNYFPLLTSRGCPYRCAFCINVVTKNIKWRGFDAERAVFEIERLVGMGFRKIWFWDENFFVNKKRLLDMIDLLSQKNISFEGYVAGRADYISDGYLNADLLNRIKNCGFVRMGFGFESGSQRILDYLQKDITTEQIVNASLKCSQAGIRVSASFMIGVPAETKADIRKTVEIIGKISQVCQRFGVNGPQFYRPYPGSKLYQDCLKAGWIEPNTFAEWSSRIEKDFYAIPDPYQAPWVNNPAMVNLVYFYAYMLAVRTRKLLSMFNEYCQMTRRTNIFLFFGSLGILFLSLLGKLRYKLNFPYFLWEKMVFYRYHPNSDY